jgi:pimeloyl-ACP methyl ester carboxylesterase
MKTLVATLFLTLGLVLVPPAQADTAGILEGALAPQGYSNAAFGGRYCAAPYTCEPVSYQNVPFGQSAIDAGAVQLDSWIAAHPGQTLVVVGHSEGGQVAYTWMNMHSGDPVIPGLSFVSFGNPNRKYGGFAATQNQLPDNVQYAVLDVTRQYDGAADQPNNPNSPYYSLAQFNAFIGMLLIHPFYADVNLDDPRNVTWTEGNVTYMLVPTDLVPLLIPLQWLGPGIINPWNEQLKAQIEDAYIRPTASPTPVSATVQTLYAASATEATTSSSVIDQPGGTVAKESNEQPGDSHRGGVPRQTRGDGSGAVQATVTGDGGSGRRHTGRGNESLHGATAATREVSKPVAGDPGGRRETGAGPARAAGNGASHRAVKDREPVPGHGVSGAVPKAVQRGHRAAS